VPHKGTLYDQGSATLSYSAQTVDAAPVCLDKIDPTVRLPTQPFRLSPQNYRRFFMRESARVSSSALRERLSWPASITSGWVSDVCDFNWVLVDIGPESMATGVVGFLYGAFIPTMRLMRHPVSEPNRKFLSPAK
jgi:hypothetical protein